MPHTTETSNMLFVFNSLMKSFYKKTKFGNSHVTNDVITLDATWGDILWQMVSCCRLTVFYVQNCQSFKAFFLNCLKGFWDIL